MEVLLRTIERRVKRPTVTIYKPVGSIITAKPLREIRRCWIGWIARPTVYPAFEYAAQRDAIYKSRYNDVWYSMADVVERGKPTSAEWDKAIDDAWTAITADGDVMTAFPKDPRGDVHATDAWIYTPKELKAFFAVKLDEDHLWLTRVQKQILPYPYDYIDSITGKPMVGPRYKLDWEAGIGLDPTTLAQIRDPNYVFDPRLNIKVNPSLIEEVTHG